MKNNQTGFLKKYKNYLLIALAILGIFIFLTILLLLFSAGPQEQPFVYQVF